MSTAPVQPSIQTEPDEVESSASSWDGIRGDESIQYEPVEIPPPEPPGWLEDFFEWLADFFAPLGEMFGASWPIFKWVLIAAAATMLLYILWKLLAPVLDLGRSQSAEEDQEWVPAEKEAIALLDEADQLAAAGRYDEATHLLLQRSVGQISAARPDWVEPSSTARELASLEALPSTARKAFGTIAERVERSLFALKKLGADDWQAARDAYAEFALQRLVDDI